MTRANSSPLRLLAALAAGILTGLMAVILLPFLFVFWLTYWLPHELDALSRAAVPSPTDDGSWLCGCNYSNVGVICTKCGALKPVAVQCDGGEEDTTPLVDAIMRDNFIGGWTEGRTNEQ
jgi:hypothetical protein